MRLALFCCVALTACASATKTYTPDGKAGYSLDCSGTARSWGMCFEKAGELCADSGYDVIAQTGDQGAAIAGTQTGFFGTSTFSRSLLIRCKS